MNRELIAWYFSLSQEALQALLHRYADAPVISRLLAFLGNCKDDHFTTQAAVKALYPSEFATVPFPKLRNRFFKIRKELLSLPQASGNADSATQGLSEIEAEFYSLRKKVRGRNADTAIRGLSKLALKCKQLNLFELYPYILHERLYGIMLMNQISKSKEVLEEIEIANRLQADWNQVLWCYRKAFEAHQMHYRFEAVQVYLTKIRKLAAKHSDWPRFKMAYLYACVAFEMAIAHDNAKGAMKHLSHLESLMTLNPHIPIYVLGKGHYEQDRYQVEQFKILYHFNAGNFELAYESLMMNMKRVSSGEIDRTISESEYRNKIKLELSTGRFQNAIQSVKDLIHFQKTTGRIDDISLSYQELALIYVYAYPDIQPPEASAKLIKHLEERLKILQEQQGKSGRAYAEALVTMAALLLILKKYISALEAISQPEAVAYYGDENFAIILPLYQLPLQLKGLSSEKAKHHIETFIHNLEAQLRDTQDTAMQFMCQFMLKIARKLEV